MQILVCGASGQLGQELAARAPGHGLQVCGLSHRELDIADREAVMATVGERRPALIINAAAYTAVDKAESDVATAFAVNRDGVANLAHAAARWGLPLFHVSTDYVFDGSGQAPYRETDAPSPAGVYGASKLAGEQLLQEALAEHLIVRTSWVFSRYGSNFVKTMLRIASQRDALSVVDDQIGCPTHAGALAEALLQLAARHGGGERLSWGVYHYCGAPACSWFGFAEAIFRLAVARGLLERAPQLSPIGTADYPTPARRPAWSVLDCQRFERAFGIAPTAWQTGLDEVLAALAEEQSGRV